MLENSSEKRKPLIFGVAILFLLGGIAGGGWWWYQSSRYVSTDDSRIDGTIVSVSAKIPGKITEVLVKEGDQIRGGQIIARIDARDALVQRAQAEASLAAAKAKYDAVVAGSRPQEIGQSRAALEQSKAEIDQAQASMNNAEKNYERMNQLFQEGAISAAQKDDARTAYVVAQKAWKAMQEASNGVNQKLDLVVAGSREEEIRAAAAQVKQAEAALEGMSLTNEYTTIIAPIGGIVVLKSVNPGEVVAAGQTLFSVVNDKDVWLNARIEETKIGKIKLGQSVDYTIDGYPGHTFTGIVFEIGGATNSTFALIPTENASGNFTKVTQRIPVKITLPENIEEIVFRPGMQALVDIHVK
jgi:membrane fusion protein (multidrug efflux system)